GIVLAAAAVALDESRVRERGLRILVERLLPRVRGRPVEREVLLLHVLAVVALGPREPEEPLLQDRVALVPEREREAEASAGIAEAEQAVLAPAIGAAARVVVREVVPAVAPCRVVLAHRRPLPFGEIRPPQTPVVRAGGVLRESRALRRCFA